MFTQQQNRGQNRKSVSPARPDYANSRHVPNWNPYLTQQSAWGNQALQQMLRTRAIQAKLRVNQAGDKYEQEADRVAVQVMRMPDSEAVGVKPRVSTIPLVERQASDSSGGFTEAPAIVDEVLSSSSQPLDTDTRAYFEPRFGRDFSRVRVHIGSKAAGSARVVNALAYTAGHNIVFGDRQYASETLRGQRLLAHELTHIVQQENVTNSVVQRMPLCWWLGLGGCAGDKSSEETHAEAWRYVLPAGVQRSVVEIQGVVGTTPNGEYDSSTRDAVEKYQRRLRAAGLYDQSTTGLWDDKTDAAHARFAEGNVFVVGPQKLEGPRSEYNCAGFAFKTFTNIPMHPTKSILDGMKKLGNCSQPCPPYYYKFWYWEFSNTKTILPPDKSYPDCSEGEKAIYPPDFHVVGGQTDENGRGPDQVMSKDGPRPVMGPNPPLDWKPLESGPADGLDGKPVTTLCIDRQFIADDCFCSENLPGQ